MLIELGRLLIPVNYTRGGPFEHDLALGTAAAARPGRRRHARPARPRPSDGLRFLRTSLERERNRVEHALRAALRLVRAAEAPAL